MSCVTVGDPWAVKQHHWKSEATENHHMRTKQQKSYGPNQLKYRALCRDLQLKSVAKLSTVIGLITKPQDSRINFRDRSKYEDSIERTFCSSRRSERTLRVKLPRLYAEYLSQHSVH